MMEVILFEDEQISQLNALKATNLQLQKPNLANPGANFTLTAQSNALYGSGNLG